MTLKNARDLKTAPRLKTRSKLVPWLFSFWTLLLLASIIRMWGHWFDILANLGLLRAAGAPAAVTGAALIFSWWLNTGND